MAKPRIFLSSTCYDLKHIRSSIEVFIETLGYEAILSEKGDIAYLPDSPLDDSCYREAAASDIFIIVIGGRYGAEVSGATEREDKKFFKRYESITKKEFEAAHSQDIPIFILIEKSVYAEYRTYKKNIGNDGINYAHVDSVNVFILIDNILSLPRNNPVFDFENASDIEGWLRDQWSGLFRELLKNRSQQKQLLALTQQISDLQSVNETLKNYLEVVLKGVAPDSSSSIIAEEEKRLSDKILMDHLRKNVWFKYISDQEGISEADAIKLIDTPNNTSDIKKLYNEEKYKNILDGIGSLLLRNKDAQNDFNAARELMGKNPVEFETAKNAALRSVRLNKLSPGSKVQ